ncbi:MAG: hypothetical protein Q4F24_17535 [Eubacteriales bacterium]|nr:hypothetical protein [Eubacteriales bacterium]
MNATTRYDFENLPKILVDTEELRFMLSCGRVTALKIGELAGARVDVGRRTLWNAKKIMKFIESKERIIA